MDDMELTLLEDDNILDLIQEAPGDEGGGGDNVDLAADDAGNEGGGDDNADKNDDANNNDDNTDQKQDDNKGDQEKDDNFDIDTEEDDTGNDEDNEDEGGGGEEPAADTGGKEGEPEETEAEKERNSAFDRIYDQLTPAEKQRRDSVLRHQYRDLYLAIDGIINDTSEFPNTTQTNKSIRLLIKNLRDFKSYISFYLTNIYSTKSHLENKIQYDTFMQIFHGIEKIYSNLSDAMGHEFDSYGREISKLNKD